MATMQLQVKENVHVLTLINNDNENKFTLDVMNEYLATLDAVESYEGDTALLIRCEHEKTFSTGINLDWLIGETSEQQGAFVKALETVLYRLALLSAPTVVALNGNVYAGGAILACAADFRVMRADRGRFCFPEVNINIPFSPLMTDIIDLLPNKHALKHMALTGIAYTGEQCKAFDIVDSTHAVDELQQAAFELAKGLAQKNRTTYSTIRNGLRTAVASHGESLGLSA